MKEEVSFIGQANVTYSIGDYSIITVLISLIKRRQGACSEDQNTSLQKRTFCYIVATAHIIYVGCNVHVA